MWIRKLVFLSLKNLLDYLKSGMKSITTRKYIKRVWVDEYDCVDYFYVIGIRGNSYYYQYEYVRSNRNHVKYAIDNSGDLPCVYDERYVDTTISREEYLEQLKNAKIFLGISE